MSSVQILKLQPLRIPAGWGILFNTFFEIDPIVEDDEFINADFFSEDLLFIEPLHYSKTDAFRIKLDLGWYPEGYTDGSYRLTLIDDDFEHVLKTFTSKDRMAISTKIEHWLEVVNTFRRTKMNLDLLD